jgi:hypothetical protein
MISHHYAGIAAGVLALGIVVVAGRAGAVGAQQSAPVRIPTPVLERYVGEYGGDGDTFKITLKGDTLFQETKAQRRTLVPIS